MTAEMTSDNTTNDFITETIHAPLDRQLDGAALAEEAKYSRFHFQRLFRERTGETPGDCRRRILLERAAYQLCHTQLRVTDIAFEALYDSLAGFSRAFRRAHGVSPSHYRRLEPLHWLLPAPNDIHYDPVVGAAIRLTQKRNKGGTMDLTDRLLEHDLWLMQRLLAKAAELSDEQLDAPLTHTEKLLPFEPAERSVRELLERLIFTKEVWVAAVQGRPLQEQPSQPTVEALRQRMEATYGEFLALARRIRDEQLWDDEFIDLLCEPPETFTYGGMLAHVINFSAYRRLAVIHALGRLGLTNLTTGCPMEYEFSLREQQAA